MRGAHTFRRRRTAVTVSRGVLLVFSTVVSAPPCSSGDGHAETDLPTPRREVCSFHRTDDDDDDDKRPGGGDEKDTAPPRTRETKTPSAVRIFRFANTAAVRYRNTVYRVIRARDGRDDDDAYGWSLRPTD